MLFFILSSADVNFSGQKLWERTYTTEKALPTITRIKLVDKKEFAAAALNLERDTYIVHVVSLNSTPFVAALNVYPSQRPLISGLIVKEALIKVFAEYSDFADIFYPDLMFKLLKHIGINNHTIKLVNGQQSSYKPIYILAPVELETLKAYIETNLANSFIKLSKSLAGTPFLFDRKSDGLLRLCVDDRGLNNLIIKNRYLLPLIGELLDRLEKARRFT